MVLYMMEKDGLFEEKNLCKITIPNITLNISGKINDTNNLLKDEQERIWNGTYIEEGKGIFND